MLSEFIVEGMVNVLPWIGLPVPVMIAADPPCKLDVLWHDGNSFPMDRDEVGILVQPNQIRLRRFLQRHDSRVLEPKSSIVITGNLPHKSLEWHFPDQWLGRLLVLSDISQGHRSWTVATFLLDTAADRGS